MSVLSKYEQAENLVNSEALAISLLVFPVSLTTLVALGIRCYREKRLRESLPLLATQLNSAIIWGSSAAGQVGYFYYGITGTQILKGDPYSLRNWMIGIFLFNLIFLEPLNLFLYTWRFVRELEQGEKNTFI